MPINWIEVKKAIKEYKREKTIAFKSGYSQIIDFFEWVKRNGKNKAN